MVTSTVFLNNRTQAVRLPKAVALPEGIREVSVRVVGQTRVIEPLGTSWDDWFDSGVKVEADFLADRAQGTADRRDQL